MLKNLYPNMIVESVQDTIDFYEKNLGFKANQTVPDENGVIWWADIIKDDVTIMLHAKSAIEKEWPILKCDKITPSLTYYIITDEIGKLYEDVKNKGVSIFMEMQTAPYGAKEFAITDNNKNILVFSQIG